MRIVQLVLLTFYIFPCIAVGQNFEWLQWSPDPGLDSDYDNFNAIATDPMGNTYMAVQYSGVLSIGEYTFQSNFIEDICLLKYDVQGEFVWAKAMGSLYWDQVNGMDCDADGNLYLTGHYFCVLYYENDSLVGNAGGREMYLMKILPDGQVDWAVNGANVWDDEGTDVRAMPGGGVVMSGRANNTSHIGNLQLNHPEYYMQEFLAYFDDDGVGQWIRSCGPTGSSSLFYSNANLEIGPDSSIFIGYSGGGEIVIDSDTIRPWYYPEFSANYDLVLQRWSPEGDRIWGWIGGSFGQDIYGDIGVDPQGRLYATINSPMGSYFDNTDLPTEAGYWSTTVYRWDSVGSEDTSWHWVSSGFSIQQSVVCDVQGNAWFGGILRDTMYMTEGTIYSPTDNYRHGLLFMINGQSNLVERLDLITGNGWRTVAALEYNSFNGNIELGGSTTAGPQGPAIFGLGEDIVEGYAMPGNWAYLASYNADPCIIPLPLLMSDSMLCPGETVTINNLNDSFFPTWNNGSLGQTITTDIAMDVTFTAIDSLGCIFHLQAEVAQAEAMQIDGTVNHLQCYLSANGAIDIDIVSGQEPFEFSWSSGQDTEDVSGLNAGFYNINAISAQGCEDDQTFTVSQPQAINSTITESNGILSLGNVTGGTPPFTFQWNQFIDETGTSVAITEPGNYSVTITDANECIMVESIVATEVKNIEDMFIAIGPNPSQGEFSIVASEIGLHSIDYYVIENASGQIIKQAKLTSTNQRVELQNSGIYFIRFWDVDGNALQTQRIIVK